MEPVVGSLDAIPSMAALGSPESFKMTDAQFYRLSSSALHARSSIGICLKLPKCSFTCIRLQSHFI